MTNATATGLVAKTRNNEIQSLKLRAALESLLAETLTRGFHGTAGLEWAVQDGSIQHIRRRQERLER